jgi:hypothetical protein
VSYYHGLSSAKGQRAYTTRLREKIRKLEQELEWANKYIEACEGSDYGIALRRLIVHHKGNPSGACFVCEPPPTEDSEREEETARGARESS